MLYYYVVCQVIHFIFIILFFNFLIIFELFLNLVFLYSLLIVCTRPGLISIFIFCCITSFFGAHYSNIPGIPITDGDEEDEKDSKIEE